MAIRKAYAFLLLNEEKWSITKQRKTLPHG